MTMRKGEPLSAADIEAVRGVGPSGTTDAGTRAVDAAPDPRYLVSVPVAGRLLGIGRTRAFRLVNSGFLLSVKVGRSRLVPVTCIEELVHRLILEPNLLSDF